MANYQDDDITIMIQKYSDSLMRMAFLYLKNVPDAQDMTQEAFLTYLKKKPKLESESHLEAWLMRVIINKCKNHLKSSWLRKRQEMPEDLSYLPEDDFRIVQVTMNLDVRYRTVIHLYYYMGYSIKEIAKLLNRKETTIGTWLKRSREKMRKELECMDEDK